MKPGEYNQIPSNEMPKAAEDTMKAPFEIEDREAEIALAKKEFDDYMQKLCAAEDDPEVIVDCLREAKDAAFQIGKYKLMAMFDDEIEKRETTDEDEEDLEEAVA